MTILAFSLIGAGLLAAAVAAGRLTRSIARDKAEDGVRGIS
jgi:hypothetical protein